MRHIYGDKQATKEWCRERRDVFVERLSLGYRPRIVWSKAEWDRLVPRDERSNADDAKGSASIARKLFYIDIDRQLCRHDADDTIAHELVHLRWHSLPHGAKFNKLVAAVRRGVRFGPFGSRLPTLA